VTRLVVIENADRVDFIDEVEAFLAEHECWTSSIKFQRNLYYKGIGSSAGATPGAAALTPQARLDESFLAFILYESKEGEKGDLGEVDKSSASTPY
jgi:hypothetical protein